MRKSVNALLAAIVVFLPGISLADGAQEQRQLTVAEEQAAQQAAAEAEAAGADKSSSNFKKTGRFLPGEETVTPTGKKVKVWSTEGPVPVSQAPQPFEDREKSTLNGAGAAIVVDVNGRRLDERDLPLRREEEPDSRNR